MERAGVPDRRLSPPTPRASSRRLRLDGSLGRHRLMTALPGTPEGWSPASPAGSRPAATPPSSARGLRPPQQTWALSLSAGPPRGLDRSPGQGGLPARRPTFLGALWPREPRPRGSSPHLLSSLRPAFPAQTAVRLRSPAELQATQDYNLLWRQKHRSENFKNRRCLTKGRGWHSRAAATGNALRCRTCGSCESRLCSGRETSPSECDCRLPEVHGLSARPPPEARDPPQEDGCALPRAPARAACCGPAAPGSAGEGMRACRRSPPVPFPDLKLQSQMKEKAQDFKGKSPFNFLAEAVASKAAQLSRT